MQDKHKAVLLKVVFVLSVFGMLPLLGGVGTKIGLWEPMTGFRMTMGYLMPSSIAALLFLFFVFRYLIKDNKRSIGCYIAVLFFAYAGYLFGVNQEPADWTGLRGIHDITTDMENPPKFKVLLDAPGRRNSFDYPSETAERQKAKFPWIKPLVTDLSPIESYERALAVAKELNWDVVGEDSATGRFEATDYTKWFNFHDDLVVRVAADGSGSRIDLRSLSRVGGSDHGLGAIRIMKFQRQFSAE
tara:strand:- start:100825 stop:101556 length:732 start_codon:yes stop_codon:yes gene_type:complete